MVWANIESIEISIKILKWEKTRFQEIQIGVCDKLKEHIEVESIWFYENVKTCILFSVQQLPGAHVCRGGGWRKGRLRQTGQKVQKSIGTLGIDSCFEFHGSLNPRLLKTHSFP